MLRYLHSYKVVNGKYVGEIRKSLLPVLECKPRRGEDVNSQGYYCSSSCPRTSLSTLDTSLVAWRLTLYTHLHFGRDFIEKFKVDQSA